MNRISQFVNILRRTTLLVLLMGLLWLSSAPMQTAQAADYSAGAPESPSEKQKTLYEGKRNVVVSDGEPAKPNKSTNATYIDSQGRGVKDSDNNQDRAAKASNDSNNVKNSRIYGNKAD